MEIRIKIGKKWLRAFLKSDSSTLILKIYVPFYVLRKYRNEFSNEELDKLSQIFIEYMLVHMNISRENLSAFYDSTNQKVRLSYKIKGQPINLAYIQKFLTSVESLWKKFIEDSYQDKLKLP
jgi:hypothetical protein